jgi:hypothetical protein
MELDWGCLARQIYANHPGRSKMEAKQPMRRLMIGQCLANVTYLASHLYLEYRDNCYAVKASRDRQAGRLVMTIHVSQSRLHPERTSGSLRPSESMHLPLAEYTTPRDDDVVGSRIQIHRSSGLVHKGVWIFPSTSRPPYLFLSLSSFLHILLPYNS